MKILSVGLGGVLGALARYYIYVRLNSNLSFPLGTLTVNLAGSFFLAFFLTVALKHLYHRSFLVLAVSTGFTGAFTTFSAVSVEAVNIASNNPILSLTYLAVGFFGGLGLAFAGRYLGKLVSASITDKFGGEAGGVG
ncbi:MAG: hypothetical protein VR68_15680 [Peptococcaceae bacterium BRH_c4a]|nr:MAG: hypothetical protein VR68_15680 [Peptococcaceae bacterium BRH_c4a]